MSPIDIVNLFTLSMGYTCKTGMAEEISLQFLYYDCVITLSRIDVFQFEYNWSKY